MANIAAAAAGNQALYQALLELQSNQEQLQQQVGASSDSSTASVPVPNPGVLNVVGVDGHFKVTITPDAQLLANTVQQMAQQSANANPVADSQQLVFQLQSAIDTKFDANSSVTDYGVSSALTYDITDPNVTKYWRYRASADNGNNFGDWIYLSDDAICGVVPVYSGLLRSWAIVANAGKNTSNNAIVSWADVNAGAGSVHVDGPGGAGSSWNRFANDANSNLQTLGPYPSTVFTGLAYAQTYYVAYNPATGGYLCTTNYKQTLLDGFFWVGQAIANNAFGGGGAQPGGGGEGQGGTGGGGHGQFY